MSREAVNIIIIIIIVGAVIINIIGFIVTIFSGFVRGDSSRLLQLMGTAVGRDTMAVGVEYHGGLGGMDGKNAMVVDVSSLEVT